MEKLIKCPKCNGDTFYYLHGERRGCYLCNETGMTTENKIRKELKDNKEDDEKDYIYATAFGGMLLFSLFLILPFSIYKITTNNMNNFIYLFLIIWIISGLRLAVMNIPYGYYLNTIPFAISTFFSIAIIYGLLIGYLYKK